MQYGTCASPDIFFFRHLAIPPSMSDILSSRGNIFHTPTRYRSVLPRRAASFSAFSTAGIRPVAPYIVPIAALNRRSDCSFERISLRGRWAGAWSGKSSFEEGPSEGQEGAIVVGEDGTLTGGISSAFPAVWYGAVSSGGGVSFPLVTVNTSCACEGASKLAFGEGVGEGLGDGEGALLTSCLGIAPGIPLAMLVAFVMFSPFHRTSEARLAFWLLSSAW